MPLRVGVVGSGEPDPERDRIAESIGRAVAQAGAVVVCGGLGGVMAAACRGAAGAGGVTVGLLPGSDASTANPWVTTAIPTGLGELRNGLIVRAADVLIAIGGEYGTLSEIAFALKVGRPVVGVGTWTLVRPDGAGDAAIVVADPDTAADIALARWQWAVKTVGQRRLGGPVLGARAVQEFAGAPKQCAYGGPVKA